MQQPQAAAVAARPPRPTRRPPSRRRRRRFATFPRAPPRYLSPRCPAAVGAHGHMKTGIQTPCAPWHAGWARLEWARLEWARLEWDRPDPLHRLRVPSLHRVPRRSAAPASSTAAQPPSSMPRQAAQGRPMARRLVARRLVAAAEAMASFVATRQPRCLHERRRRPACRAVARRPHQSPRRAPPRVALRVMTAPRETRP